ncbi:MULTISPECIES: sensor histidine kinase [unclassified Polaribacter]|uniref:sensor histidine kinase n=1 Tax=unclassified Polaribacter TaxID=196858 RepID=UPI0011BF8227|nr:MULTISPECIES: sensor histidine kinase [unclassified Polaribacter]TXD51041.1 sensor histidine kinase [Polaribacter sp. IC063]TXD62347.1 sensor histidine kinase [Polaribacter sp. IC066]
MNFLKSKIFPFFLFFTALGIAQHASTYHKILGERDGFVIDIVRAMNFDEDGFLWLGGESLNNREIILSDVNLVLQRFNGNTFHSIQLPKLDKRVSEINQIYKRQDGLFYLRLDVGIYNQRLILFDPVSMQFQKMTSPELIGNAISKVFKIRDEDYILVQQEKEILLYKLQKNLTISLVLVLKSNKNIIDLFTRLIPFKDFFILTDNHLNIVAYNWQGEKIKEYPKVKSKTNLYTWIDEVFVKDNSTYVFLYEDPKLYYIDENKIEILPVHKNTAIKSEQLLMYNDDFNNNLILSKQDKKISIHSYKKGVLNKIIKDFDLGKGTSICSISNNINDGFWLATEEKELHYFKLPSQKVKTFLEDKSIRAIKALNENEYLVATEIEGWFTVNIKSEEVKEYKFSQKGKLITPGSSRNIFIENGFIWSNNLSTIFKKKLYSSEIESWDNLWVRSIEKLNDSILLYGTQNQGLYTFNTKTKKYKVLLKLDSLFFYDVSIHKNLIAGATDKGLLMYNLESKKSKLYTIKEGLKDDFLLMTDYDPDYGFLVGSRSGKVIRFNEENEKFTTIYEDDLNAGIATIIRDDNKWWLHTFKGFVLFDINSKESKRFGIEDGFSNNEANRYSALKTKEGILVGTLKGLNYFKPKDLKDKKNASKLILVWIRKYDEKLNKHTEILDRNKINEIKSISIPPENRNLELDFSVTNNPVDKHYNYRYRLNSEDWVRISDQQTVRFANLSAGKYSLEIEALDFSNKKIAQSLFLEINSKNFFYKTWWFYLIISFFTISFLIWILKQTREKNKMQGKFSQDLLQSQEEERTRIARELHDSVGQQLTLIKKRAQNIADDPIAKMTNNALEEVRSISRDLYPALLKQLGLRDSIEQLINEYDEQTNLFFSMDIDEIDVYFTENTSLNFYRIIQECLTNIIKHSKAKTVAISIKKENKNVIVLISDNGKGFNVNDSKKKNSLGLKTIFERIKIMKGKLSIDSKLDLGTDFVFSIPIK